MEESAMLCIVQANIDRFGLLLTSETDPIKRAMIIRLLAEETDKKSKASALVAVDKAC